MAAARPLAGVHGTLVVLGRAGVLLRGPSGSGKSDLALRLIGGGARLVADDQVRLVVENGKLMGAPPATLAGRLEVRGLGLVALPHRPRARVRLVVDLVDQAAVPRLPRPSTCRLLGVRIPRLWLAAFEASAPLKVRLALNPRSEGV
ncbi:MAG: serine/threonine protein kinase [Alphaproteobacteria bacterium]|nr:serine/threonine protein kinase [Alphaproteobacteria bacterium]